MDLDAMTLEELVQLRNRVIAAIARKVLGSPAEGVPLGACL